MKITYDKKIDAMYLQFQTGSFSRNKEVEEGIILDIGRGNKILGIEILNASRRVKPKDLKHFSSLIPTQVLA
ncbi:MAG TPA: DUF2283 domain-containing protein [Candidatus Paceibacterota bacterium]